MSKPFLIIGAGIAGLSVALRLEQRGFDFRLLDSGINHSSKVAAGIINPIVFRRTTLGWRIHELLAEAKLFYNKLGDEAGRAYMHPIPIRRAFAHQQEKDSWLKRQTEDAYKSFLKPIDEADEVHTSVNNTFGTGMVMESYYLDTVDLIDDLKQKWADQGKVLNGWVEYRELDPVLLTYKGLAYEKIIFCEGYHGLYNPWFSHLPLQATKGQLLTIASHDIRETELLNRRCFILPLGNHRFKVGSTYEWDEANTDITEEARAELLSNVANLVDAEVEVLAHIAGVRPTVPDRRPLLGVHHQYKGLCIFNGLGAKGFLIAPLLSEEFCAFICEGKKLDREVDIVRYGMVEL